MGVSVADEASAFRGLENDCFKDPEILLSPTQGKHRFSVDAFAASTLRKMK